jgi:hypothetical protein
MERGGPEEGQRSRGKEEDLKRDRGAEGKKRT